MYVDGSVGARGSNYFKVCRMSCLVNYWLMVLQFCHTEHLRPDLDVVIVELSSYLDGNFDSHFCLTAVERHKRSPVRS